MTPNRLLDHAIAAAKAGGKVLCRYWENGFDLRDKSSVGGKSYDLVSDADLESEATVAEYLSKAFPNHELLGEESLIGDISADHLWVIDPLDGTNNFAHHVPHFAVSIGYFERGQPKCGVVLNPITGDLFTAVRGEGAFHNGNAIQTSQNDSLAKCLVGCGFYYDRGEMMRSTLAAIESFFECDIHGIRRFGTASLDLCAVADGRFGAFFEYKLSPWDFAAGQLIITEAGGKITTAMGDPLRLTPSSVLACGANVYDQALAITRQHHSV